MQALFEESMHLRDNNNNKKNNTDHQNNSNNSDCDGLVIVIVLLKHFDWIRITIPFTRLSALFIYPSCIWCILCVVYLVSCILCVSCILYLVSLLSCGGGEERRGGEGGVGGGVFNNKNPILRIWGNRNEAR